MFCLQIDWNNAIRRNCSRTKRFPNEAINRPVVTAGAFGFSGKSHGNRVKWLNASDFTDAVINKPMRRHNCAR